MPKRVGWIFVGAYCLALLSLLVFIFNAGGDMSGILILYAALPWSMIGNWFGPNWGLGIGTLLGLVLNGAIAFCAGYGSAVLYRRWF